MPESPAITKPARIVPEEQQIDFSFKAQPLPDLSHRFQPKLESVPVSMQPFERMEHYSNPLEMRARMQEEELQALAKQREFHAQPIRTDIVHLAPVEPRQITVPEPFNLESEKRHEEYVQVFEEKVVAMTEQEKKMAEFKANPVKKLDPFVPKKSVKPLTQVCLICSLSVPLHVLMLPLCVE